MNLDKIAINRTRNMDEAELETTLIEQAHVLVAFANIKLAQATIKTRRTKGAMVYTATQDENGRVDYTDTNAMIDMMRALRANACTEMRAWGDALIACKAIENLYSIELGNGQEFMVSTIADNASKAQRYVVTIDEAIDSIAGVENGL